MYTPLIFRASEGSHPAWDAWIEIFFTPAISLSLLGRIPHGMRGLKYACRKPLSDISACRIPHGMRGLKFLSPDKPLEESASHPAWDAWIEIDQSVPVRKN